MKLSEALTTIRNAPAEGQSYEISLACGFTPLHLASFLRAHAQQALPDRKVEITTGLYDDLAGSVAVWGSEGSGVGVLVLEWSDLDARLGFRGLGGWGQTLAPSIIQNVRSKLNYLQTLISKIQGRQRVVLVPPTLPLPPGFHTTSRQSSEAELSLFAELSKFLRDVAAHPAIVLVSRERIDSLSPVDKRLDLRSDLNTGFPYTLQHADLLSETVAKLLQPVAPKKGLITDLDDTLWLGLVGEIGGANVCWDLSGHAQVHGLYQQMLRSLSDQGILLAVASKNSRELAMEALDRSDLPISKEKLFPLEIHWEPKSVSISRILKTWNIAANSVVFVDDSAIELEEVKLAHPEIECRLFPKNDPAAILALLQDLRDLFGKPHLSEEDAYRLDSIRNAAAFAEENLSADGAEELLRNAGAMVEMDFTPKASERRLLELVNKTNQFNLNGLRIDDAEWARRLNAPEFLTVSVHYADRFGPLGKIAVIQARREGSELVVPSWVMSCRAFARRIEHQTLEQLFLFSGAQRIRFEYKETPKNTPTSQFLTALTGKAPDSNCSLDRNEFVSNCPPLYHQVTLHS